jgi:hypothetical protein
MDRRRQSVPGPAWAFLLIGAPLAAAGGLWVTASSGPSADHLLVFLILAFLASLVFAFSVARLFGLPLRTCARLSAWGGAISLMGTMVIGLLVVLIL